MRWSSGSGQDLRNFQRKSKPARPIARSTSARGSDAAAGGGSGPGCGSEPEGVGPDEPSQQGPIGKKGGKGRLPQAPVVGCLERAEKARNSPPKGALQAQVPVTLSADAVRPTCLEPRLADQREPLVRWELLKYDFRNACGPGAPHHSKGFLRRAASSFYASSKPGRPRGMRRTRGVRVPIGLRGRLESESSGNGPRLRDLDARRSEVFPRSRLRRESQSRGRSGHPREWRYARTHLGPSTQETTRKSSRERPRERVCDSPSERRPKKRRSRLRQGLGILIPLTSGLVWFFCFSRFSRSRSVP